MAGQIFLIQDTSSTISLEFPPGPEQGQQGVERQRQGQRECGQQRKQKEGPEQGCGRDDRLPRREAAQPRLHRHRVGSALRHQRPLQVSWIILTLP